MEFKVGDMVTFVHHKITVKGTIRECYTDPYGGDTRYLVHKDTLFDFIVLEGALTLVQAAINTAPFEQAIYTLANLIKEMEEAPNEVRHISEGLAPGIYSLNELVGLKCDHTWATYQGLFESFEHCSKCGERKKL